MTTELALVDRTGVTPSAGDLRKQLEVAREMLRTTTAPTVIRGVYDKAQAVAAAAEALRSWEVQQAATEVCLWAERRAGQIRLALPRAEQKDFDSEMGGGVGRAGIWQGLARVPEDIFVDLIQQCKDAEAALSAWRILRKAEIAQRVEVEPGIYRLPDGRYRVFWEEPGWDGRSKQRSEVVPTIFSSPAHALRVAREKKKTRDREWRRRFERAKGTREVRDLDEVYGLLRKALDGLDGLLPKLDPQAARAARKAMTGLHSGEDDLVQAMRLQAVSTS